MNFRIIIKILGSLLIIESAGMVPALLVSLYYNQYDKISFITCIIITGLAGFLMYKTPVERNNLRIKESLIIVSLGWFLVSLFGSLPFIFSGSIPSFADAFFETVAGFTTAGATILPDIEKLPYGILFWRSFTQWIGGMGVIVFTVAILPAMGVGSLQIIKAVNPGPSNEKMVPRVWDTAKILYLIYSGLTLLEIVLLVIGGMNLYEAAVHTFGSVGTGGFSSRNSSIGAFNSTYIQMVISIFMILGGINFSLYYAMFRRKWKELLYDQELRLYLGIILTSTILIALNINASVYKNIGESLKYSIFQVSSMITTTGYSMVNFDNWPSFSKGILFLLMFVGACAGSTGGAIKNIRILVLFKLVKRELVRIIHPRAVLPVKIGQKTISPDMLNGISSFFMLYMVIFVLGTLAVSMEGIDLISASSAVAAMLGNIGLGFGLVGPAQNFSFFSIPVKFLFTGLMLMGRLELFTVIVLFSRKFWSEEW